MKLDDYWPRSVAHLSLPYDDGATEHVVIAEIDDRPQNGCKGFKSVSTALVPLHILDEVLQAKGSIGWHVESWGPHPTVRGEAVYETSFWIAGRDNEEEKFQTVLNAWRHHDQEVVLPDSVMLMTYGLVPRHVADGIVCWDDPSAPVYDVIRARSRVHYKKEGPRPLAFVTMRRDYLEDYCSLKGAAAVAVYYEERFDLGDKTFSDVLAGNEGIELLLPGRKFGLGFLDDEYHTDAPQMSRVWGSRLILKPVRRPITDAVDPQLVWPDYPGPMTLERASHDWLYAYVSDEVLLDYESSPEFTIHPESGGVSYGGWWGTSYTARIGRDHIKVELKKLYEGCPTHVISHWHHFAVAKATAENDLRVNGDTNVALRAKDTVHAYLRVTKALETLSDRLGAGFSQEDIGELTTHDIAYSGWYSPEVMKPIAAVIKRTSSAEQFLARAVALFKLLENLKPGPLRNLVIQLGIPKDKVKEFAGLKLVGTLCQLFKIASEQGYEIPADAVLVSSRWDTTIMVQALNKIFALNSLRILAAHLPGDEKDRKLAMACQVFGIDISSTATGWGVAIDTMYDGLIESLGGIADILEA